MFPVIFNKKRDISWVRVEQGAKNKDSEPWFGGVTDWDSKKLYLSLGASDRSSPDPCRIHHDSMDVSL